MALKRKKIIEPANRRILFLSSTIDDQSWREEMTKENRRARLMLKKLRKMIIMEIIVKIVAFLWAFIWTGMSLITWLYRDDIWWMIFATLIATCFWFILAKSAGSIELINTEIKDVKQELRENEKK